MIRLGLKDAVATYYGAFFNTGDSALEIREQNFQFVKKEVFKEVKVEKKTAMLAVSGTTVELKATLLKVLSCSFLLSQFPFTLSHPSHLWFRP